MTAKRLTYLPTRLTWLSLLTGVMLFLRLYQNSRLDSIRLINPLDY